MPECRPALRIATSASANHLGEAFCSAALRNTKAPAVTIANSQWSYGQLLRAARIVTDRLVRHPHFRSGDRVILLLPNGAEYAAVFYGILLAGGVVVPLPPRSEAGVLRTIVESTAASLIVTRTSIVATRPDLNSLTSEVVNVFESSHAEPLVTGAPFDASGDDLAAIFFTAGSTGSPKGVMLSHRNLISNATAIQRYLAIDASERPLCVLPFHHAFGNSVMQSHLLAGAHLVLDGQTAFPESIVQSLHKHECTSFSAVPDLFRGLLEHSSLGQTPLPALRLMAVAGGALRHELAVEIACRIAPASFFVMYGQTEATARLAWVPPGRLARLPAGVIGKPVPGVTLEVVDEEGASVAPGTVGELRAKGPNVMLGYWRDEAATSERIRGGWLYTGDLATLDAEGWIIHKGRANALVKIAGFRVHPADLEDFALRRLAATQAVAVAFEAPDVGTRLALYVKASGTGGSMAISDCIARCRSELPRHLAPDFIQIVDEFPLNHALKIDRPLLARLAEQAAAERRAVA
jgi:acyl-CoA synthetase (AMP-forming)/AMP-acid ligase II